MEEREEKEIPINVEGDDESGDDEQLEEESSETLDEESSEAEGLEEASSEPTLQEESSDVEGTVPEGSDTDGESTDEEALDDLYVSPDESDVEVVEPDTDAERAAEEADEVDGGEAEDAGGQQDAEQRQEADAADPEEAEPEGPSRDELLERVDELEQRVDELKEERDDFENRMLRAAADLENFRKRAKREKEDLRKYGAKDLVKDLLQNVDNLERALEHADASDASNIIEGVEMVLRQIHSSLAKHGIEQFESEGEDFDPEKHEAIQQVETTEQESGTIVEEFQKGYVIHDRLLRPAMVTVAKNVGGGDEQEGDDEAEAESDEVADESEEAAGESASPEESEGTDEAASGDEAESGDDQRARQQAETGGEAEAEESGAD